MRDPNPPGRPNRPNRRCSPNHPRAHLLRTTLLALVTLASAATIPTPTTAQTFETTVALGGFVDYPRPFSDPYCEQNASGLAVSGAWRAKRMLSLDLTAVAATGTGPQTCAMPLFAPTPPDTPFETRRYADAIEGTGLFATNVSAVFEPFPTAPVSPRARLGVGLLWDKELGNWLWGFGIRYRFGRHSFVTDFEGWNLKLERFVDTKILRSSTGHIETLDTDIHTELSSPFMLRIGWSYDVR